MYLSKLRASQNFRSLDLHSFRADEAILLIEDQLRYIATSLKSGKQPSDFVQREIGNRKYLLYQVITGRGTHSKNGQSVLYPEVLHHFRSLQNLKFQECEGKGKFLLYLPI